jgi:G3E family GTPase
VAEILAQPEKMMGRFAVAITVAAALAAVGTITEASARTAWANGHHSYHHSHHHSRHHHSHQVAAGEHSGITCSTVRAYVSQLGLEVARAMARANGMTQAQEHRARQCLAQRD